ncbi:MAG: hypothetical protein AAFP97_05940 [Pseudomonadota bacterium]
MADRLFDRILIVDWSAANKPKTGADSIWISDSHAPSSNPATRAQAMQSIETIIAETLSKQQHLLIGWDFAFSYPQGFAKALGYQNRAALWSALYEQITDTNRNQSNRFDVAAKLNQRLGSDLGPFWGYVGKACPDGLSPKRYDPDTPAEWPYPAFDYLRQVERWLPSASPVFKLAYTGSVGSQALLGIARLEGLRRQFEGQIALWPFDTGFAEDLSAPVICAEIYPSSHIVPDGPAVKDQRQVEAVLCDFLSWDAGGSLREKLNAPDLTGEARHAAQSEEGWVVGL